MKKITVTILTIALVTLGAIFVFGQTGDKPFEGKKGFGKHGKFGKRGGSKMMKRLFRQLDLTEDQKAQLKAIRQANRQNAKASRQSLRQIRQQLADLGTDGVFNESQVAALADQQADIIKQQIIEKQKVKAQMFAVLTPEQKAKVSELKTQFKQKRQERMKKRAERFGGKNTQ